MAFDFWHYRPHHFSIDETDMHLNSIRLARRLRQKVQPVVEKFSREVGEPVYKQVTAELARLRGGK